MPNYTHICARSMLIFFGIFFPHTSVVCIKILKTILGMTERYHHAVKHRKLASNICPTVVRCGGSSLIFINHMPLGTQVPKSQNWLQQSMSTTHCELFGEHSGSSVAHTLFAQYPLLQFQWLTQSQPSSLMFPRHCRWVVGGAVVGGAVVGAWVVVGASVGPRKGES